jgi:hypothetical protein
VFFFFFFFFFSAAVIQFVLDMLLAEFCTAYNYAVLSGGLLTKIREWFAFLPVVFSER